MKVHPVCSTDVGVSEKHSCGTFHGTDMIRGVLAVILLSVLQLTACSEVPEFVVSETSVRQVSWDTLTVYASFEEIPSIGSPRSAVPEAVRTTVFNVSYDTLYHGSDSVIPIPDMELGDREPILVEICGTHENRQACEQQTVLASPKRLEPVTELRFPESEAYDRGSFRLDYRILRETFDEDGWEQIRRRIRPETYLMAYIDGHPQDAVKIPVRRTRNRFNLSRYAHYRDFRFQIKSQLMDSDSASVRFDLYVRLGPDPQRIATDSVVLRSKSQEERRSELHELVELAGGQLIDRMTGLFGARRAYVFVNSWSYQALEKVYTAEIELHWQSGLRRVWFDMIGILTVRSSGTAARFEWLQGSTSAAQRWISRMDSTTVFLQALRGDMELRPGSDSNKF